MLVLKFTTRLVNFDLFGGTVFHVTNSDWVSQEFGISICATFLESVLRAKYGFILPTMFALYFGLRLLGMLKPCLFYSAVWFSAELIFVSFNFSLGFILAVSFWSGESDFDGFIFLYAGLIVCFLIALRFGITDHHRMIGLSNGSRKFEKVEQAQCYSFWLIKLIESIDNPQNFAVALGWIYEHKSECNMATCHCHGIKESDSNLKEEHQSDLFVLALDIITEIGSSFPKDTVLTTMPLYLSFRKLNNPWGIRFLPDCAFGVQSDLYSYALAQYFYAVEVWHTKEYKKNRLLQAIDWKKFNRTMRRIEQFYSVLRDFVETIESTINAIRRMDSSEMVLSEGIERVYRLSKEVEVMFDMLKTENFKRIFFLYYHYLQMQPRNGTEIEDLEVHYRNYLSGKASIGNTAFKISNTFVLRVSANKNEYSRIMHCTRSVEEILLFKQSQVEQQLVSKMMLGNLKSNHEVFVHRFFTENPGRQLKHYKENYLLRRDGYAARLEVDLYFNPNIHKKGLEFFAFCRKLTSSEPICTLIVSNEGNSVWGVNDDMFAHFGVIPYVANGYNDHDHEWFFSRVFSELKPGFLDNPKLKLERGLKVMFDFEKLFSFVSSLSYNLPAIDIDCLKEQLNYLSLLRQCYRKVGSSIKAYLKIVEESSAQLDCNYVVLQFKVDNREILQWVKENRPKDLRVKIFAEKVLTESTGPQKTTPNEFASLAESLSYEDSKKKFNYTAFRKNSQRLMKYVPIYIVSVIVFLVIIFGLIVADSLLIKAVSDTYVQKFRSIHTVSQQNKYVIETMILSSRTALALEGIGSVSQGRALQLRAELAYLQSNMTEQIYSNMSNAMVDFFSLPVTRNASESLFLNNVSPQMSIHRYLNLIQNTFFSIKNQMFQAAFLKNTTAQIATYGSIFNYGSIATDELLDQVMGSWNSQTSLYSLFKIVLFAVLVVVLVLLPVVALTIIAYESRAISRFYFQLVLHPKEFFDVLLSRSQFLRKKILLIVGEGSSVKNQMSRQEINNTTRFVSANNLAEVSRSTPNKDFKLSFHIFRKLVAVALFYVTFAVLIGAFGLYKNDFSLTIEDTTLTFYKICECQNMLPWKLANINNAMLLNQPSQSSQSYKDGPVCQDFINNQVDRLWTKFDLRVNEPLYYYSDNKTKYIYPWFFGATYFSSATFERGHDFTYSVLQKLIAQIKLQSFNTSTGEWNLNSYLESTSPDLAIGITFIFYYEWEELVNAFYKDLLSFLEFVNNMCFTLSTLIGVVLSVVIVTFAVLQVKSLSLRVRSFVYFLLMVKGNTAV